MVIYPATRSEQDADAEREADGVHWANCELAKLLKLTPDQKRNFNPFAFDPTFYGDDFGFTFTPPVSEGHESTSLLGVVEEAVNELLPLVTALLELRHRLRKQS